MSTLLTLPQRRKRWKPPVGARVNWGHPLSRALRGYWTFAEGGGEVAHDLVAGNHATKYYTPAQITWTEEPQGSCIDLQGDLYAGMRLTSSLGLTATAPWTISWRCQGDGDSTEARVIGAYLSTSTNVWLREGVQTRVYFDDGSYWSINSLSTFTSWTDYVLTSDGAGASSCNVAIYVDGVLVDTSSSENAAFNLEMLGTGGSSSTSTFDGRFSWCAVWDRVLLASEISSLYVDPFQFLDWPTSKLYLIVPSAGGGTTKTVSDSVGVADALGGIAALVSIADTIVNADGLGGGIGAAVPIADAVAIADSQTTSALVQIAESISTVDSVSGVSVNVSIADLVGISEAPTIQVAFAVADSVGVVDSPTVSVALSIADAVTVADSIWSGIAVRIADAIGVSDVVAPLSVALTIGEAITVSDAPTIAVSLSVPDSITATDGVDVQAFLAIADALGVSDGVAVQIVGTLKAVADAVGVSDSVTVPSVRVVISDVATVTDAIGQVSALLSVLETVGVSDAVLSFDSATKIVEMTFTVKKRSMDFEFKKRSMGFTFKKRSMDFEFN